MTKLVIFIIYAAIVYLGAMVIICGGIFLNKFVERNVGNWLMAAEKAVRRML